MKYRIYSITEVTDKRSDAEYVIAPFAVAKERREKCGYGWVVINNWNKSYCYGSGEIRLHCERMDNKFQKVIEAASWNRDELKYKDMDECIAIMDEYDQKAYELGAMAYMEKLN